MNKRKAIAVAIVLAMLLLIGGMLAYFTDTDTATNIFTLGDNVDISLSETWTAADGLGLYPGTKVVKAPSIHNESATVPAYVFAEVIVPCYDSDDDGDADTPLFILLDSSDNEGINSGWTRIDTNTVDADNKTITYVYAYGSTTMTELAGNGTTSTPVFSKVQLAPTLTAAQKATALTQPNIVVNAYGIQTTNLDSTDPATIFEAF